MPNPPNHLNEAAKKILIDRFGTILNASESLDIPYERLKRSLQSNKFNQSDTRVISRYFPEGNVEGYEYEQARAYTASKQMTEETVDRYERHIEQICIGYNGIKRELRGTDLTPAVERLYKSWPPELTMVLFFHHTVQPEEWESQNIHMKQQIKSAVGHGGKIVYVSNEYPSDEPNKVKIDHIDLGFKEFSASLSRHTPNPRPLENANKGFVALLRPKNCPFCFPFKKCALFLWRDGRYSDQNQLDLSIRAVNTFSVPATIDGKGVVGGVITPESDALAGYMYSYMEKLLAESNMKENYSALNFNCYPLAENQDISRQLSKLF